MSCRAWTPPAFKLDGRAPLGSVPPASLRTSCIAVAFRLGKPLGRGNENGAAAAIDAAVEARTTLEKCML